MVKLARHAALELLRRAAIEREGWIAEEAGVLARLCSAHDPKRCARWQIGGDPSAEEGAEIVLVVDPSEKGRLVVQAWRRTEKGWAREETELVEDAF